AITRCASNGRTSTPAGFIRFNISGKFAGIDVGHGVSASIAPPCGKLRVNAVAAGADEYKTEKHNAVFHRVRINHERVALAEMHFQRDEHLNGQERAGGTEHEAKDEED